ncbi:uncharacterized protein BJ212DRAFT_594350 [Suillus subaureus]|uniref:Uncharacterized protein n=1 Tax=Suillus subaureus TaxID=48587 RepID=A0A9P7J9G1_9AGAM|nr:uncharacterized protein BJ212DRAFT_594350 [Suillus subaureus]KAG1809628.1 hypothetical protein BJ212DRAFT_594350 [Suillus subaureus]
MLHIYTQQTVINCILDIVFHKVFMASPQINFLEDIRNQELQESNLLTANNGKGWRLTPYSSAASVSHVPCDSNQAQHILSQSLMQFEDYKMVFEKQVVPKIRADDLVLTPIRHLSGKMCRRHGGCLREAQQCRTVHVLSGLMRRRLSYRSQCWVWGWSLLNVGHNCHARRMLNCLQRGLAMTFESLHTRLEQYHHMNTKRCESHSARKRLS